MIFFVRAEPGTGPPPMIALIFPLHILTMLIIAALTAFYIVNVFRNERVDKDKKVLWAVVLFMGSVMAMPVYWYLYIWKEGLPAAATAPGQLGSGQLALRGVPAGLRRLPRGRFRAWAAQEAREPGRALFRGRATRLHRLLPRLYGQHNDRHQGQPAGAGAQDLER